MPGHLAGTENRCPSPPAAYADQQQLSHNLHEWLEAALLQHANLNTSSSPQAGQTAVEACPEGLTARTAYIITPTDIIAGAPDADWEQVQDAAAINATALLTSTPHASSNSDPAMSISSVTDSLDDLEVPFAGLSDAAVLLNSRSSEAKPSNSPSSSDPDVGPTYDHSATVVIVQDAAVPLESELQHDSSQQSSVGHSSSHDDDWSVVSGGSS